MQDNETKVKSFRITDETADKFKVIASEIGGNQQIALAKLIECYEMQQGKAKLNESKTEIEKFEGYTLAINRMFISALENNQNLKETIRAEFEAELKAKDDVIKTIQLQLEKNKKAKNEAEETAGLCKENLMKFQLEMQRMNKDSDDKITSLQEKLQDKDKMNNILQASCESLTLEINELRDKAKNFVELEEEFMQLKKKEKEYEKEKSDILLANEKMKLDLEKEYREVLEKMKMEYEEIIKDLKSEIEIVKNEKNNIQINSQKEILDLEKLHAKEIEDIKNTYQQKIDAYQEKYISFMSEVKAK